MLTGVLGRPFVDLEPHLDLTGLDEVHEEICLALAQIPVDYTGGSHRSMGIVPPSLRDGSWADYGEVIRAMNEREFATLRSLGDDPAAFAHGTQGSGEFGEERDVPLSRRQMLWLERRFGVYFPWKVYVELIPNRLWGDRANPEGKAWNRIARSFFPKTMAFVKRLPFVSIGRCNVMGLDANDFGTVHRDADPAEEPAGPFITLCPAKNKRLFLWDEDAHAKTEISSRAYWFNDGDYHGVEPDPWFRYSLRVDGVFRDDFLEKVQGP